MAEFDVIIIGSGINGLTAAAYLAKAGARVLVIERRHETGGGLVTEDFGGFRYNLHATYHMMAELMPLYQDFKLNEYGCSYIFPDVQIAFPLRDGRAIILHRDPEKSANSIARFSEKDARAFLKMHTDLKRLCDEVLIPATYVPMIPPGEYTLMLQASDMGKRVLEISEMSPKEIVESYGFEDEYVKALLLYLACMWGIDHDVTGVGYMVALYMYRMTNASVVKGGSHRLSSALVKVILENRGEILEDTEVSNIMIKDGKANGVKLADGRQFQAKAVASTVDVYQTFTKLVEKEHLTKDFLETVKSWTWESKSLFGVHLSLREPPKYKAADFDPNVNEALIQVMGFESGDELISHWKDIEAGKLPPPAGHTTCTTIFDPSQAPCNLHVGRWETAAPYEFTEGSWDDVKEKYADRCTEVWMQYTSNLEKGKVINRYTYSPLDIERKLIDMVRGSFKQGAYIPTQMGYFRPNDLCSQYRTPIKGLYICGASVYPGGMILAGGGYNAASIIAEDLAIKPWWRPPSCVIEAREKKLIP